MKIEMVKHIIIAVVLCFLLPMHAALAESPYPLIARGDGSCMGMIIKKASEKNGSFEVESTGAKFYYKNNTLKISQGLSTKRDLALIDFSEGGPFELIKLNQDHTFMAGKNIDIIIYGDSSCVIAPKKRVNLTIKGRFKPDYTGKYHGELLFIDNLGGIAMYTNRNSKSYKIDYSNQNSDSWEVKYSIEKDEQLMIAAFPGRPFDWEKSFRRNIVFTQASFGKRYGIMPPNWLIQKWSQYFNVMVLWHGGLYDPLDPKNTYSGPYVVANPSELKRAITMAHLAKMKVTLYTSFYYFFDKYQGYEDYIEQIKKLKEIYDIDGVYIDGMLSTGSGHENDQVFINWETIRRLRLLFGREGVIIYHGTSFGHDVATIPLVDTYCDATLYGENVPFKSIQDKYVQYQVRKYGISNTIALWKPGPHPKSITDTAIIDAVLNMNGRLRYWAGAIAVEPTAKQPNIWISDLNTTYEAYLKKLIHMKEAKNVEFGPSDN